MTPGHCSEVDRADCDFLRTGVCMGQQALAGLVLRRRCNLVSVVLIVHLQRFVPNLNGPDSSLFRVAINIFEGAEVEALVLEHSVVVNMIARLLFVELGLEYADLVVQLLQLVEECRLLWRVSLIAF